MFKPNRKSEPGGYPQQSRCGGDNTASTCSVRMPETKESSSVTTAFESYFKIGVSEDYILLRDDFPISTISPSDFSRLCMEMFRRNEESLSNGK